MTGRRGRTAAGASATVCAVVRAAAVVIAVPCAAGPAAAQPDTGLPPLPATAGRRASPPIRQARDAQRRFELARRRQLDPYMGEAAGRCEITVGRLCYWDNNGDPWPPPERPAVRRARRTLLDELAQAAAAAPGDDWIAGQRVRYLVEAARAEADSAGQARPAAASDSAPVPGWRTADSVAAACGGTPWWCQALVGYAAHAAGRHAAALTAFDSARALLPDPAARCAWDDVSPWLPPRAAAAYRRLPCGSAERARYEARAWRLAQPFWTLDANDLRAELAARRTLVRLHASGEHPQALPWGADLTATDLRYGVPTAWTARDAVGTGGQPSVVGHEPTPSYDFWPDGRVLDPGRLLAPAPRLPAARDWAPRRAGPPSRYAPAYAAAGVYALPHQLARFRRGDTLVVVGAYDARDRGDSVPPGTGTGPVRAGFVLDDLRGVAAGAGAGAGGGASATVRPGAPREGALVLRVRVGDAPPGRAVVDTSAADSASRTDSAPAAGDGSARWVAALEVLDPTAVRFVDGRTRRGRAGWARDGVAPLAPAARLSDVLVVRPGLARLAAPTLAAAADSAVGGAEARVGAPMGLYWEQYGGAASGAGAGADTVVITATRLAPSLRERLGALVGRSIVLRAVSARYAVAATGGPVAARAVTLTWTDVPPGAYRLEVSVPGPAGAPAATSAVVVRVSR